MSVEEGPLKLPRRAGSRRGGSSVSADTGDDAAPPAAGDMLASRGDDRASEASNRWSEDATDDATLAGVVGAAAEEGAAPAVPLADAAEAAEDAPVAEPTSPLPLAAAAGAAAGGTWRGNSAAAVSRPPAAFACGSVSSGGGVATILITGTCAVPTAFTDCTNACPRSDCVSSWKWRCDAPFTRTSTSDCGMASPVMHDPKMCTDGPPAPPPLPLALPAPPLELPLPVPPAVPLTVSTTSFATSHTSRSSCIRRYCACAEHHSCSFSSSACSWCSSHTGTPVSGAMADQSGGIIIIMGCMPPPAPGPPPAWCTAW